MANPSRKRKGTTNTAMDGEHIKQNKKNASDKKWQLKPKPQIRKPNVGALIVRKGSGGPLYYAFTNKDSPKQYWELFRPL